MKLLALRAASFRRFMEGVAVEDLHGGVNLLAGPNELGKSTLFQALEAAFLIKHGTTGSVLDSMRPRAGGEPLVEADFEALGRRWRIRKQFGRGKGAILTDVDSGRIVARAGEAEDELARLTGARGDGPGRIGLVWVRQQRALQPPDLDIDPATGRAKVRGEANALIELLNSEVIEAAGSGLAERIAKRAQAELDALVTSRGAKKGSAYDKALAARDAAQAALDRANANSAAREQRRERIVRGTQMLAEAEDPAARAALSQRIELLEKALSEAGAERERTKGLADQVTARELEAKDARRALADAQAQTALLRDREAALEKARTLDTSIAALAAALNANAATSARLNELENATAMAKREEQALEDMSTFVDIEPAPSAAGRIVAGGQPIHETARVSVPEQLTVHIEGVGTIRVTSSDAKRAAAAKRRRDEQHALISQILQAIGVEDVQRARDQAKVRLEASIQLDDARRALSAVAPRGVAALQSECAALATALAAADLDALARIAADKDVVVLAARHGLEQAKAEGLDEKRYENMAAELAAARRDLNKRQDDARRFSEHLERLKGEQDIADQEAGASSVETAQAAFDLASADVQRCEEDIAALRLLCATLTNIVDNVRTRYLEPVSNAFLPYLTRVFPGAAADFREGFSLQALRRAGEEEEFATLSDGTREQLAVLVRLGFARLFADRGAPVPLVLDDPLVYSDDARLAAMCAALNDAGSRHQVIVITCRESAFAPLGSHKLSLSPWRDTSI